MKTNLRAESGRERFKNRLLMAVESECANACSLENSIDSSKVQAHLQITTEKHWIVVNVRRYDEKLTRIFVNIGEVSWKKFC